MAFDPLPQSWFTGLTDGATVCLATDLVVPIATFPELTAAEIDSVTGDIRKMLYAICEKCWLVWAALLTADKPNKMTISKSSSANAATGLTTHTYIFTFVNSVTAQDVAPEV
jgi:hypothetical protein